MSRRVLTFSAVIGLALLLWLLAVGAGGSWALMALLYITLGVAALDTFTAFDLEDTGSAAEAKVLSIGLGFVHFIVLFLTVASLTLSPEPLWVKLPLFAAAGLYLGQVSNANAHELIHAPDAFRRRLGRWNYITLLYGHHTSAHPGVHHVHVATPLDPNSARKGESYWRFFPRCWVGAFRAGLALEQKRLRQKGLSPWHDKNPYWAYLGGAAGCLGLIWLTLGLKGVLIFAALCGFAQSQLIISDYVQHYGLRRTETAPGKFEPLGPAHSWDAPHWASSALMLNAPRHADHHMNPSRGFEALRLPEDAPQMPWPLPVMAVIALYPRLWKKVMAEPLARVEEARASAVAAE